MPNIGPMEIGIVLIIALIVFGPNVCRSSASRSGKGISEFKGTIGGESKDETPVVQAAPPVGSRPGQAPPRSTTRRLAGLGRRRRCAA